MKTRDGSRFFFNKNGSQKVILVRSGYHEKDLVFGNDASQKDALNK